jgi:dihydrofolate synthase/folylpolyglutamate synthase
MPKNIVAGRNQVFDYHGITDSFPAVRIDMLGAYQVENACLATAAIECLRNAGMAVGEPALRRGLEQTQWEGRMELVSIHPDIFLDGAHNPASAKKLAQTVGLIKTGYRRVILVIGILKDKDHFGILSELVPVVDHVVATKPQYFRAMDDHMLAAEIAKQHASVDRADTVENAVAKARMAASPEDLILVTGSLYVVGEARGLLATSLPGIKRTGVLSGLKG